MIHNDPVVRSHLNAWRAFIERHAPANVSNERCLQDAIDEAVRHEIEGRGFQRPWRLAREVAISPEDRIDFILQERFDLGIEVKVDGSLSALLRQLQRYAQHDAIDGLLVVSTRAHHRDLPATLSDKPVVVASLLFGGL